MFTPLFTSVQLILSNGAKALTGKALLHLDIESFASILSADVACEEIALFQAVQRYVAHHRDGASTLIPLIRFPLMSEELLAIFSSLPDADGEQQAGI